MRSWKCLALFALLCTTLVVPVFAQRVATITLGRDPEPPFCIQNPGGTVQIFWDIQHTTTPRKVEYFLQDPTRTINLEQQTYPGGTGLNIARSWNVPNGLVDGKYWVRVEYWSFESGNEANAEVTFYICAEQGNLCVYKYKDANCNGILDPNDPIVTGWWVCITTPEGDTICRQTNGDGKVCWFGIPLGTYEVFEPPVDGWSPIGPDTYTIDLIGGEVQNVNFFNVKLDECYGACCFEDGTCRYVREADCAEQGGVFHGIGTTCDPNPCPQPEACCFPDGHCEYVLETICLENGGTPYGVGTDCDPNPCDQPPMACCFPDGHCEFVTEELCMTLGGIPQGYGTSCDPNPCPPPPMACCFPDGHCEFVTADDCTALGGTPQGYGTDCEPNDCPQPPDTGACCLDDQGHCEVLTEAECARLGGQYQGNDTTCDPNPCPIVPTSNTTWGRIKANYR
jgi:hypothetical protein